MAELRSLRDMELGLDVLVEVHDGAELERALRLKTSLIGINNRNLRSFEVSAGDHAGPVAGVPADRIVVTESGILSAQMCSDAQPTCHAFLVGEAFMRADDPGAALAGLFGQRTF
jgi:indole-3-glycerol phosphate synthase